MVHKLLSILIGILVCSSCQNQNLTRQIILKSLQNKILASLELENYSIDNSRNIIYNYGSFSGYNKNECLIEFPMIKDDFKILPLFLFEKP